MLLLLPSYLKIQCVVRDFRLKGNKKDPGLLVAALSLGRSSV